MSDLAIAKDYARSFCDEVKDEIEKVEFVGAVRRGVRTIETISLLIIPKQSVNNLGVAIVRTASARPYKMGAKLISFSYIHYKINVFIASWDNYELLKFIRTGPETFIKKSCQRAKELNLKLHADGSGIEKFNLLGEFEKWLRPQSEEDIFLCLGWPYIEPQNRI